MPKTKSEEKTRKDAGKTGKKSKKPEKDSAAKSLVKAAKLPPKPKKATKSKGAITNDEIALRAYFIAERRTKMGWHGDSTSDWVEAEKQLRNEAGR